MSEKYTWLELWEGKDKEDNGGCGRYYFYHNHNASINDFKNNNRSLIRNIIKIIKKSNTKEIAIKILAESIKPYIEECIKEQKRIEKLNIDNWKKRGKKSIYIVM